MDMQSSYYKMREKWEILLIFLKNDINTFITKWC